MDYLNFLLPTIEHFYVLGYWIAFFAALLETTIGFGLLLPGSSIILFMGVLAGNGYFDVRVLILFAIVGAILGDNLNYYFGKKYGASWIQRKVPILKPHHLEKVKVFFNKHGSKSVFLGRFVPSVKELVPFVAGTVKMKQSTFMFWNTLGAIGWSLEWVLPGYIFAQSLGLAEAWLSRTGFFFTVLFILFVVFYALKLFFIKKGRRMFAVLSSVWSSVSLAVVNNPEVQKLVKKHESFFGFLKKRLNKDTFWGLPLTVLILAFLYTSALFVGIIEDIVTSDIIVSADTNIANLFAMFRNTDLTEFFFWITLLGKWQVVLAFTVSVLGILWVWRKREYIVPFLITIVGSGVFIVLSKSAFHRPRPGSAIYTETGFSFPSGHATIAVAFYGFLMYVLIRNFGQWKTKVNIFFTGLVVILLIGLSRLYLGVHYVSDVWGGYLVGMLWLIIGISISEWLCSRKENCIEFLPQRNARFISVSLIALSFVFYGVFAAGYHPQMIRQADLQKLSVLEDVNNIFINEELKYTETLIGTRRAPVSFVVYAQTDDKLKQAFGASGWYLADKIDISSVGKLFRMIFLKQDYLNEPMSLSFWGTRPHDLGFGKPAGSNGVRKRHNIRIWKTNYVTKEGNYVYIGTTSLDSRIKWGIVHKVGLNVDAERELFVDDLKKAGVLTSLEKQKIIEPTSSEVFSRDGFFTDGYIYIISIK